MIISIINHTNGLLSDSVVQRVLRAVNRQIEEDFAPYWGVHATLRLEGRVPTNGLKPLDAGQHATEMRGEGVIYLWHPMDVAGALGYHAANFLGVPYGFVFPEGSRRLQEPWTATLSHEALEMIADPQVNLLVMGPHPANPDSTVFFWQEVCDAVQNEGYTVDGVLVSNFVLPLYFTHGDETGSRNDFLGNSYNGRRLRSFGTNPGGYMGYFNPATGQNEFYLPEGDQRAALRLQVKSRMGLTRRSIRYQYGTAGGGSIDSALRTFAR